MADEQPIDYETYGRVMHVSDDAVGSQLYGSEAFRKADLVITDKGKVIKHRIHPEFVYPAEANEPIQQESQPTFESFDVLISKIHQWGVDRNIIGGATAQAQFTKLVEEFTEGLVAEEVFLSDESIKDGIGDSIVVLTQMAGIDGLKINYPVLKPTGNEIGRWDDDSVCKEVFYLAGKIGSAVARGNKPLLQVLYDRVIFVLYIRCTQCCTTLEECLTIAYTTIKDRKGVMYNGAFVKATDERYPAIMAELGKTID